MKKNSFFIAMNWEILYDDMENIYILKTMRETKQSGVWHEFSAREKEKAMLNEKEFCMYVENHILNYLPELVGNKVIVQQVKKNNQITMMGLSIGNQKNQLLPVLYLDPFYKNYLMGQDITETVRDIACVYRDHQTGYCIDEDKVADYEQIKKNLFYRLINYEKNQEMLKYCPHERFLDLAVTYRWAAYKNADGMASAMVRNKELLMWGVSKEQMIKDARKNTEEIFPVSMRKIQSVLPVRITDEEIPLFVLSNGDYMNGASVILYDHVLRDFAEHMGHDLYILPSSIHEVIILLDDEFVRNPEELAMMVRETNRMVVNKEEVLSDHIYHYDREKDEIRIAK